METNPHTHPRRSDRRSSVSTLAVSAVLALAALAAPSLASAQPGVLDPTFGVGGKVLIDPLLGCSYAEGSDIAVQPDQKILISTRGCGPAGVVRLNASGTFDTTFGVNGVASVSIPNRGLNIHALALQSDGRIVIAGQARNGPVANVIVARFTSAGTLDPTFGAGAGYVETTAYGFDSASDLRIQPDGKIIAAGTTETPSGSAVDFVVVRYNADGTLDSGFGASGVRTIAVGSGVDRGRGLALQPDGKIVVSGYAGNLSAVVRLNANGSLDSTFGTGGIRQVDAVTGPLGVGESAEKVAVQSDGKIVVAGYAGNSNDVIKNPFEAYMVFRLDANGTLDGSFGTGGVATTEMSGTSWPSVGFNLAVLADGRIAVAGMMMGNFRLVLHGADGALDASFGTGGISDAADFGTSYDRPLGIAVQADGKFVLAGTRDINPRGVTVARYGAPAPVGPPPDTEAPVIASVTPSTATLWPPNHQMVAVTVAVDASDNVGVTSTKIVAVSSSEPADGLGDGDTANDVEITGPLTVTLRAERSGKGGGRTYTITVEVADAAGNTSHGTCTVVVPKSRGGR